MTAMTLESAKNIGTPWWPGLGAEVIRRRHQNVTGKIITIVLIGDCARRTQHRRCRNVPTRPRAGACDTTDKHVHVPSDHQRQRRENRSLLHHGLPTVSPRGR
jgi:hypothetical protein